MKLPPHTKLFFEVTLKGLGTGPESKTRFVMSGWEDWMIQYAIGKKVNELVHDYEWRLEHPDG
jgi:hypothetical protein